MPSLMSTRWVGQNSGPIFRRLRTKVYRIQFLCAGVSAVCNAVFRLTMSCCFPEIFAIKSRCFEKIDVFGPPNFRRGEGPPKFLTEFYKSRSPSDMLQRLMTISQATSEIRRREKINYSAKTEWPAESIAGEQP